ncbi:MAG: NUDIX domain-containing protein [Candidatus Saccharibacteria bacterium]
MKFKIIPSVNFLLVDGNKILLSRRLNTGWLDGHLCIPGGHVEEDETPRQAALREMKEELDLEVGLDNLEFLCVLARVKQPDQYVGYEFVIRGSNFKYKNAEPENALS